MFHVKEMVMDMSSNFLAQWLDERVCVSDFKDDSWNGLQVANSGRVGRICVGVDATLPFFEAAVTQGAGMVICHHGISWGPSLARITGLNYRLVSFLIKHDMALYGCHLPLDAHPELGNNGVLARVLGLEGRSPFACYNGQKIGICGELAAAVEFEDFADRVRRLVNIDAVAHNLGSAKVKRVGVVSGGAAMTVAAAIAEGLDTYITGEPSLAGYNLALQEGINVIYAGHYATEVFGVKAVLQLLKEEHGVEGEFVDQAVPY
jgi:dinuclear metal center YbgI/SA1388 family protein